MVLLQHILRGSTAGDRGVFRIRGPCFALLWTRSRFWKTVTGIYRWWFRIDVAGHQRRARERALRDCGDEGRDRGLILRAGADRVDRLRLAVVENRGRKIPIDSSARIDVAAVVAHVRRLLLRIEIDRRRCPWTTYFGNGPVWRRKLSRIHSLVSAVCWSRGIPGRIPA